MSYIFGKLWHLAIIWAIRKSFKCILQGVRFLLANHTRLSPTSDNESYTNATSFIYSYGFPLVLILIKVCSVRSLLDSFKVLIVIFFGNSVKSDYCQCIVVFVLNLLQNNYDYDQKRTSQEAARKIWMDSRIFLLGVFSTQVRILIEVKKRWKRCDLTKTQFCQSKLILFWDGTPGTRGFTGLRLSQFAQISEFFSFR